VLWKYVERPSRFDDADHDERDDIHPATSQTGRYAGFSHGKLPGEPAEK